jgi:hypothetical protein
MDAREAGNPIAEIVALVEAGDVAALKAYLIKPYSSSPKAMARYRDLDRQRQSVDLNLPCHRIVLEEVKSNERAPQMCPHILIATDGSELAQRV